MGGGGSLNYYLSLLHHAIGWASYKAGRVEEGRNELERALELWGENTSAFHHLGQVFEHMATEVEATLQMRDSKTVVLQTEIEARDAAEAVRTWLDKAEESYIAGLEARSWGENPFPEALGVLYERRHGSREGLDEYLAAFSERDRSQRHQRILESRLDTARTYEPFVLPEIDGEFVDSAGLDGKIAVLHFWGTWCGPCVAELPEYQKFHARYLDDPRVEVVSISNDISMSIARDVLDTFMVENEYDFTVLVDDGYVQKAGVNVFPTTWFVDGDGYIQFIQEGGGVTPIWRKSSHGSSRRCAVPTGAVRASFCTLDLTESSQNQLAVSARCMRRIAGSITCRGRSAVTSIRHVVSDSTAAATAGPNSGISETLRAANPKA